ncbi:MAG: hypothetical protein ACX939_09895, partial [Hyphococcus sp.]
KRENVMSVPRLLTTGVFGFCAAFTTASAADQQPIDETVCEAIATGVDAVFSIVQAENSNVPLREKRAFADRFPKKRQGSLQRPSALPKTDWRAFKRIDVVGAPSACEALQRERFGFTFGDGRGASTIGVMDLRKSETGSEFLMRLSLVNDTYGDPTDPSSLFVTLITHNEDGNWSSRLLHIFKVFRSGNASVTEDCKNPDDFDDCITDINF